MRPNITASSRSTLLLVTIALAACSTLPDTDYPPQRGFDVVVTYDLGDDDHQRVEIPASDRSMVILELRTEPATDEQFQGEERYLTPRAPSPELRVYCRGRVYGERRGDGVWFRPLPELFPGARTVETRGSRPGDADAPR